MFWKLPSGHEHISKPSVIILGFSVWIIYVLDRLLDNQKNTLIFTERHFFHQLNQRILWFCIIICIAICVILLFFIPFNIIKFGIVIFLITALYLLIVNLVSAENSFQHFKEPLTAFVYTAAVWGTAILNHFNIIGVFLGLVFFLITFQNLLLFSYFELKSFPETNNLAQFLGKKSSKYIILGIFLVIIILGGFSFVILENSYQYQILSVEILMSFSLVLITYFQRFTLLHNRFRWLGDGIFLLPLLIIL
ncbi:MAG: hypothetical protein U5N85_17235 [Arcicella sp.]|nr:hypothetical protein [Arcicella sp.]